ncbi:hypothetical protein EsH8_X_000126 [Colletotrichum jinshuiense]
MKEIGEEWTGEPITHAVVTVPWYLLGAGDGPHKMQAIKEISQVVDLTALTIIQEPRAVTIGYHLETRGGDKNVLIYELGKGNFEVSAVRAGNAVDSEVIEETLPYVEQIIKNAGLTKDDIQKVALVGDYAQDTRVRSVVEGFFNGKHAPSPLQGNNSYCNSDEAIMLGTALQDKVLSRSQPSG